MSYLLGYARIITIQAMALPGLHHRLHGHCLFKPPDDVVVVEVGYHMAALFAWQIFFACEVLRITELWTDRVWRRRRLGEVLRYWPSPP